LPKLPVAPNATSIPEGRLPVLTVLGYNTRPPRPKW
jgi:hypothetical protein